MLTLEDLSTFRLADGSLPGAYGVRLPASFSDGAAGTLFADGVPEHAITGHGLRRLVASGLPVLAAWRVGALGEDLGREIVGDASLVLPQVGAPPIVFGDILSGLDELPKRKTSKKKGGKGKPPPPPPGVVVGAATSAPQPPEGEGEGDLAGEPETSPSGAPDATTKPPSDPESGG